VQQKLSLVAAARHKQGYVICLFRIGKLPSSIDNLLHNKRSGEVAMRSHNFEQAVLAKLFPVRVHGFCHTIGINDKDVAGSELHLRQAALHTCQIVPSQWK
jgi:hypothetical protein